MTSSCKCPIPYALPYPTVSWRDFFWIWQVDVSLSGKSWSGSSQSDRPEVHTFYCISPVVCTTNCGPANLSPVDTGARGGRDFAATCNVRGWRDFAATCNVRGWRGFCRHLQRARVTWFCRHLIVRGWREFTMNWHHWAGHLNLAPFYIVMHGLHKFSAVWNRVRCHCSKLSNIDKRTFCRKRRWDKILIVRESNSLHRIFAGVSTRCDVAVFVARRNFAERGLHPRSQGLFPTPPPLLAGGAG